MGSALDWQVEYRRFRDGFAEGMDSRLYTIQWLDEQVAGGNVLLWFTMNAAIAAEIKTYPTGAKAIHGLVATGDKQDIKEQLIPAAEAWGKANGCIGASIESREGWARELKSDGYRPYQTALWKEL